MVDMNTPVDGHAVRRGHEWQPAMFGAVLVAIGASMLAERTGLLSLQWRSAIWPVLLMALGVANLLQPTRHGRQGFFLVSAGAWWFAGLSGWISMTRTWPLLIVALGASIVVESLTAPDRDEQTAHGGRRHSGAVSVVLAAILAGAFISGDGRDWSSLGDTGTFHVVSIMGRTDRRLTDVPTGQSDLLTVMGRSSVDLRQLTVPPGSRLTLDGLTIMGTTVIQVPDDWVVDVSSVSAFGRVRDDREGTPERSGEPGEQPAAAPPRLAVRGAVIMGALVITSRDQVREPARDRRRRAEP